ncbi:hypothetical protein, variant [Puccinia triticina 1-1 BBBD Race 1]|uniref:chitin deacetylase n=1 Tax=Puccinia triticina (isolate 1-1 / race 1 (BBBD)) TaxID=630390 RepID=A0A180FZ66_PUCT1|nr:hypothetical protein, variant [Puccinia triticina 1-1 BBBD Race 1]
MIGTVFGHHRRLAVILTMCSLGWMLTIELGGGQEAGSAGSRLSASLRRQYPGTPTTATSAGLDWLGRGGRRASMRFRAETYPGPATIGPRPKREWIRRLQFVHRHAPPALQTALALPPAGLMKDGYVVYPSQVSAGGGPAGACSWENSGCLRTPEHGFNESFDIVHPDPNTPLPPSETLYKILDELELKATHFWIGGNVLKYRELALKAARRGDHLAVHTWSHSHLTSLTNHQILGELGWTMQIIADLTGKVPRFFRPPYGNIDNRVRAIAKHVFGLETVIWNWDSVDWGLNQTYATGDQVDRPEGAALGRTVAQVAEDIARFAGQPAAAGLILEHELSLEAVEAFRLSFGAVRARHFGAVGPLPVCLEGGQAAWYQQ